MKLTSKQIHDLAAERTQEVLEGMRRVLGEDIDTDMVQFSMQTAIFQELTRIRLLLERQFTQ